MGQWFFSCYVGGCSSVLFLVYEERMIVLMTCLCRTLAVVARPVGMFSIYFMPGGGGVMLFVDFIPFFVDFMVGGGGKGMSRNAFFMGYLNTY